MNLHFFSTTSLKTTTIFSEGVLTPTSPQALILGTLTISTHEILDLQVSSKHYGVKGRYIDHCYSLHPNFVLTNLPTTRMVKSKWDMAKE
jgi:hypothetical protein